MIEVTNVAFAYPHSTFRLRVPKLAVSHGRTVAMIGPSGSGKTTLLQLIAGVLVPAAGRVMTGGVALSELGDAARRDFRIRHVGLVFQEFELLEHLNVWDNILLPCRITSAITFSADMSQRAAQLAAEMGITDKLRCHPRKLSHGERQRVALCRALLCEPPLLLCDEPTGNLDPVNKQHVLDVLMDYVQRHQTTLLTVTHDHQILPRFDETIDFSRLQEAAEADA